MMGRLEPTTLPSWQRVVDAVHGEGAGFLLQIWLADRVRRGTLDLVGVGRMHIANNDFVAKVRAGRWRELALFSKQAHLVEAMEQLEPGFVEESRKNVTAE
jgi:2,4-dienoyl-CoA reductase-like NADH-dependent reductase (Old Yellow Enzyme family)